MGAVEGHQQVLRIGFAHHHHGDMLDLGNQLHCRALDQPVFEAAPPGASNDDGMVAVVRLLDDVLRDSQFPVRGLDADGRFGKAFLLEVDRGTVHRVGDVHLLFGGPPLQAGDAALVVGVGVQAGEELEQLGLHMKEEDAGAVRRKDVGGIADGPQRLFAAVHGHENFMVGSACLHAKPPGSLVRDGSKIITSAC